MIKTDCLFSGSKGNCVLASTENTALLIDAGVSLRSLKTALESKGVSIDDLDGVLITHEHSDHVKGLGQLCLKYPVPVYVTPEAAQMIYDSLAERPDQAKAFAQAVRTVREDATYQIGDIDVTPFATPHDSVRSVGYVLSSGEFENGREVGIATDIGFVSKSVSDALIGCRSVIIESNHDVNMLKYGTYPEFLKERILSACGHLSNADCAEFCKLLVSYGCRDITLFHLSDDNNTRELAFFSTYMALLSMGVKEEDGVRLSVAPKNSACGDAAVSAIVGQIDFDTAASFGFSAGKNREDENCGAQTDPDE